MPEDIYRRITGNAKFQALVSRRQRFAWTLAALMLGAYLAFILAVAFAPQALGTPLAAGMVTRGNGHVQPLPLAGSKLQALVICTGDRPIVAHRRPTPAFSNGAHALATEAPRRPARASAGTAGRRASVACSP